jgi:hypothetical protein
MKIEIRSKEIVKWFEDNKIPIYKTKIYVSRPFKTKGIEEPEGVFLPRFYEGYVFTIDNLDQVIKAYVHESSHGSFIENFPVGMRISELDRKVYKKERELFGEKNIEDIYVVTTSRPRIKSRKIDLRRAKVLTKNKVQFKIGEDIFEVDRHEFQKYIKLSEQLNILYSKFLTYIEGFALIIVEEVANYNFSHLPLSEPYRSGYEMLKPISEKDGMNGLIKKLCELNLNI